MESLFIAFVILLLVMFYLGLGVWVFAGLFFRASGVFWKSSWTCLRSSGLCVAVSFHSPSILISPLRR